MTRLNRLRCKVLARSTLHTGQEYLFGSGVCVHPQQQSCVLSCSRIPLTFFTPSFAISEPHDMTESLEPSRLNTAYCSVYSTHKRAVNEVISTSDTLVNTVRISVTSSFVSMHTMSACLCGSVRLPYVARWGRGTAQRLGKSR